MSEPSSGVRLLGALLMGIGALIAGLSGLCTAGFTLTFFYSWLTDGTIAKTGSSEFLGVFLPLLIGGLPILFGLGLFFLGRYIRQPSVPID